MQSYKVTLTGETPMLMHADDLKWRSELERWLKVPENKKKSKAGDDRTPAWKWIGCCYHNGKLVGVPSDNLMTTIREGASKVSTGKKGATFKRQSQSGIVVNELLWPLLAPKGTISWVEISELVKQEDFSLHEAKATELGFELFSKPVRVGQSKHIRVRPRFDSWSTSGTITVFDDTISEEILVSIFEQAGMYCGLCDWRPSSPSKPGPYGRFTTEIQAL